MRKHLLIALATVVGVSVLSQQTFAAAARVNYTRPGTNIVAGAPYEGGVNVVQNTPDDATLTGTWIANQTLDATGVVYFTLGGALTGIVDITTTDNQNGLCTVVLRSETDPGGGLLSGRTIPAGFPTIDLSTFAATPATLNITGQFRDPGTQAPVTICSNLSVVYTRTAVIGSCCLSDNTCIADIDMFDCFTTNGGVGFHPGRSCGPDNTCGTCCYGTTGGCFDAQVKEWCDVKEGAFGPGLHCSDDPACVPALSEWGLILLSVIGLTAGTIVFRRRRAVQSA